MIAPAPAVVRAALLSLIATALLALSCSGLGEGSWEMKVCASPDAYPLSSSERPGFENRIAEILADEMGANLSYVWTNYGTYAVRNHLQTGNCDMLMGVIDGASGVLNTVPYYRAPFVFVYRHDADFTISSFLDESLRELTIAVPPNSLAQLALYEQGLRDRVVLIPAGGAPAGSAHIAPLVDAVEKGEADVAIVYGPYASEIALARDDVLEVTAVTPEIVPPFHRFFRSLTLAVRMNDESFRDRLNLALASRWDDIQSVFDEYGVPQLSVVRPRAPGLPTEKRVRIGLVVPSPSGRPSNDDMLGSAARLGALVTENLLASQTSDEAPLEVFHANAPTPEAAVRAAERLVATEDVVAVIGGVGSGQAEALAKVAAGTETLFFNIGDSSSDLRHACSPFTFHIQASERMYLRATFESFAQLGSVNWFLVVEDSDTGRRLHEAAIEAIEESAAGASFVTSTVVPSGPADYHALFAQIASSGADGVLLLLGPQSQEFFLSQYEVDGPELPVAGYPHTIMQSRFFYSRLQQVSPFSGRYRVALWDPLLEANGALEFNRAFMNRSAMPADPTGWAAFASSRILHDAVVKTGSGDSSVLIEYLEDPSSSFDVLKGGAAFFDTANHQLRQSLYLIEIDPEADWALELEARLAFASIVAEIPPIDLTEVAVCN